MSSFLHSFFFLQQNLNIFIIRSCSARDQRLFSMKLPSGSTYPPFVPAKKKIPSKGKTRAPLACLIQTRLTLVRVCLIHAANSLRSSPECFYLTSTPLTLSLSATPLDPNVSSRRKSK